MVKQTSKFQTFKSALTHAYVPLRVITDALDFVTI